MAAAAWAARARQRGRSKLASHHSEGGDRRGFSEGAANALLACSKRGASSAAHQARRSKRGAASAAQQARRRGAGRRGSKVRACVQRPTLQRGHWCMRAMAQGAARGRACCWRVRWGRRRVARRRARAGRSGVGSAGYPGMWAGLRAGAECPGDGCAEGRGRAPAGVRQGPRGGCSQARRRAGRGSTAPWFEWAARCRVHTREGDAKATCGRVDCRVHQCHESLSYEVPRPEITRPYLLRSPGSYYHWFITTRSSSTTAWLSDVRQLPASTVTGTARTQVSHTYLRALPASTVTGSHAPLLDRNGRLISESSRSRAAS